MRTTLVGSVLALAFAISACSGSRDPDPIEGEKNLDLLTWWSQDSELAAIDAVIKLNDAKHPKVHIRVLKADSTQALGIDVQNSLVEGTPPTAFQANLGGNALQWADSAQPLNERAKAWASGFQDNILERLSVGDDLIAVPLALTRQNNAYYNLRVLEQVGLDIPEGREGLQVWLDALTAQGYTHPLCMGDAYNWISAHALFEDIVPGYIGAEHAEAFWTGQLKADDALFAEALDYAATLNSYWNADFDQIDWDKGLKRLMEVSEDPAQQCVMTLMGDWGGPILAQEWEIEKDFAQRAWPGAEDLFVLAGDAFVTTRGVKNEAAALDFFDTLASEEGQIAFNRVKGSVPARTLSDKQARTFGPLTRANMADLAKGTALPGFKVLGSSAFPWDDLAKRTHDFILTGDKQPIINVIAKNYAKLTR